MKYRKVPGRKHPKDEIICVLTSGFEAVTNKELLYLVGHILENEERIYPREDGFQGCDYFWRIICKMRDAVENKKPWKDEITQEDLTGKRRP